MVRSCCLGLSRITGERKLRLWTLAIGRLRCDSKQYESAVKIGTADRMPTVMAAPTGFRNGNKSYAYGCIILKTDGVRDHLLMLMTYRHGLRVSEVVDLRLKDLDLDTARPYVRGKKGSLSTHQPLE